MVGWNCGHAANFCVNEYTESLPVRRLFLVNGLVGTLVTYYLAFSSRRGRSIRTRLVLARTVLSLVTIGLYNAGIRRFWRDVGREWRTYEGSRRA